MRETCCCHRCTSIRCSSDVIAVGEFSGRSTSRTIKHKHDLSQTGSSMMASFPSKREVASLREKQRIRRLTEQLMVLKACIPDSWFPYAYGSKAVSKIVILQTAISYIRHLSEILNKTPTSLVEGESHKENIDYNTRLQDVVDYIDGYDKNENKPNRRSLISTLR